MPGRMEPWACSGVGGLVLCPDSHEQPVVAQCRVSSECWCLLSWNLQRYREHGWESAATFMSCQAAFLGCWRGCGFGWMNMKAGAMSGCC